MYLRPPVAQAAVHSKVVVLLLLSVTPVVGLLIVLCFVVHSSFAIIFMGKRELVALLCLSS